MAKVTIDSVELFAIQERLRDLEQENEKLKAHLETRSDEAIMAKSNKMAVDAFKLLLDSCLRDLGYSTKSKYNQGALRIESRHTRWQIEIGRINFEDCEFELKAELSKGLKVAFVEMGLSESKM